MNVAETTVQDQSRLYRWGVAVAHRRRAVLAGCGLVLAVCAALYPSLQGVLSPPNYVVEGSESARVEQLLEHRFHAVGTEGDVVVFYSHRYIAGDRAYRKVVAAIVTAIRRQPEVHGVVGPFDTNAVAQIAGGEHAALAAVALDGDARQRYDRARALQQLVAHDSGGGVNAWLTGYSPITADLSSANTTGVERAEAIGVPVALLVLLVATGALLAALLPLMLAGAGLLLTYGLLVGLSTVMRFDAFLVSVVTMIGIGIGIDYTLFVVNRFREQLAHIDSERRAELDDDDDAIADAVGVALETSGRTVLFSGVIVALALASVIVVNGSLFKEVAIGATIVVAGMLSAALVLLPAVLAQLGPAVNRGRLPALRWPSMRTRSAAAARSAAGVEHRNGFGRWAVAMMRYPLLTGGVAAAVLVALALPALGIRTGVNLGVLALSNTASGKGERVLANAFSAGGVAPIQIIVSGPGERPLDHAGLTGANELVAELEHNPKIAGVVERRDDGGVLLTAVSTVPVDTPAATALVRHIRDDLAPRLRAKRGAVVLVGGVTAFAVDLSAEMRAKLPLVLALMLGLSLLSLMVVFRSVVLPFKAIVMNLLSTGATLGLVVLVFQDGHGERLLGFTSPGYIQAYLPLLVFALLFGLSMDYEVFLVRRIQEEWKQHGDNEAAVVAGVQRTARPISAAAAIMVAVFGCFVTAELLELKELGFALAAAVALDATLVRLVLVPSLMGLFGAWNWWFPFKPMRRAARVPSRAGRAWD